jgi:hypothetical protein
VNLSPRLTAVLVAAAVLVGGAAGLLLRGTLTPSPYVELPASVEGKPGRVIRVQANANGAVQWFTQADIDLIDQPDNRLLIVAPTAGRYLVYAYTARGGKASAPASMQVVVGEPGPAPPPVPPTPPVPPPEPTDLLWPALKAAYAADLSPTKATDAKLLASLYRQGADVAQQPGLTTTGQLLAVLHDAAEKVLGDRLAGVRRAVADEFNRTLPRKPDAPLDAPAREAWRTQLTRAAELVGRLP